MFGLKLYHNKAQSWLGCGSGISGLCGPEKSLQLIMIVLSFIYMASSASLDFIDSVFYK